ncbi:TonB-dependent receptor plug domain-containing protein [Flagellimonas sp.]|uniref:YfaP family protein n=1 Tax=Flagellimonas sp. TaxID=2058762 RepID=UPI003F4A4F27
MWFYGFTQMKCYGLLVFVFLLTSIHAQQPQKTAIFWDTSYSRLKGNTALELDYLEAYFQRFTNSEVLFVAFSDGIHFKENHTVRDGNWNVLKERIQQLKYDGATSFNGLEQLTVSGYNLVFTDGYQNLNVTNPKLKENTIIINSSKDFDRRTINLLSIIGNVDFLDLSAKKEQEGDGSPKGVVQKEQKTDSSQLNMKQGLRLQEVVVTETKVESADQENTPLRKKDKDALGYAVQSVGSEKILAASTTLNTGIQGKFSGVSLGQNDDLSQAVLRPSNSLLGNNYGLIVVDGVPLPQSQSSQDGTVFATNFIDPENVEDITVLKGLAATNIYGTLGTNGVLMITTKTGTYGNASEKGSDAMQLKDNFYDAKIKIDNKALITPYLKALKKGKSVESAYDIYLNQRMEYRNSPNYLLDVFDFFQSASPTIAFRVLSNVLEMDSPTYQTLRGAYLKSVETKNIELAENIVIRLLEEHPEKTQNFYDYARVNRAQGNYQNSLNTLTKLLEEKMSQTAGLKGMEKTVGTEIRNLINQHRTELDISKIDGKYKNNITYNARLILEWSNPNAEFVVQFVNPQKRFFNWEHTKLFDPQRFRAELEEGYSVEQFEIVGSDTRGEWILNITSKAEENPTFVKCTVVNNFGKNNQKSTSYMVRLQDENEKMELAKFTVD